MKRKKKLPRPPIRNGTVRVTVTVTFFRRNMTKVIDWANVGDVVVTHRGEPLFVLSRLIWMTRKQHERAKASLAHRGVARMNQPMNPALAARVRYLTRLAVGVTPDQLDIIRREWRNAQRSHERTNKESP